MNDSVYSPESTRNVVIIYGFLFVILSALISASVQSVGLSFTIRFSLYVTSIAFGLAALLIGLGLVQMIEGLHPVTFAGIFLLTVILPAALSYFVGSILMYDSPGLSSIGFWFTTYLAAIIVTGIVGYDLYRKYKKR